jgi:hypothetical protein
MPKRISKPQDVNQAAFEMVRRSTSELGVIPEPEKRTEAPKPTKYDISRVMSAMGRKGGKVSGKRRMVTMTPEQRHNVALKAAQARWAKHKKEE